MSSEKIDKEINQWLDSIINAWSKYAGSKPMPFPALAFNKLAGDLYVQRVLKTIKKSKELGFSSKDMAETMMTSHTARYELAFLILDAKNAGLDKEDRLLIFDFFSNLLDHLTKEDKYAKRSLIEHSPGEIKEIIKNTKWITRKEQYKEVSRISLAGSELMWALWSDTYPHTGYNFFGPYDVSKYFDNGILLIKDFFNFKPIEIWPETENFQIESLKIFIVLKDCKCELDLLGHLTCDKNIAQAVTHFAVFRDKKPIDSTDELRNLREYLEKTAVEQFQKFDKSSFEEKKKKHLLQRNYQLKNFFAKVGMDWKPTQEEYQRIKGKKIPYDPIFDNEEKISKWTKIFPFLEKLGLYYIRKLGDPRSNVGVKNPHK